MKGKWKAEKQREVTRGKHGMEFNKVNREKCEEERYIEKKERKKLVHKKGADTSARG